MRFRSALLITLAVVGFSSCLSIASGQTRRRVPQTKKRTPLVKYEPLPEHQKRLLAEILDEARALEVTYQYDPSRYFDESSRLAERGYNFTPTLPDGVVKNAVFMMVRAYADAGYLYSTIFPHRETESERSRREAIEALEKFERSHGTGSGNAETYRDRQARERNSRIASILRIYDLEGVSPYQARQYVFARAQVARRLIELMLPKIPTAPPTKPQETLGAVSSETSSTVSEVKPSVNPIVGRWLLEFTLQNNVNYKIPLTVQVEDNAYNGLLGDPAEVIALSNITVSGNNFSFTVPQFIQGRTFSLTISGNVEGNRITGTYSMAGVSNDVKGLTYSVPLTGTRATQ